MISLLLTLFISLFSFCPSYCKVEDHQENIINDVGLQDKKFFEDDTYYSYSYSDLVTQASFSNLVNWVLNVTGGNLPLSTYYINIAPLHVATWETSNFSQNDTYPYNYNYYFDANYIYISARTNPAGFGEYLYDFGFCDNTGSSQQWFSVTYAPSYENKLLTSTSLYFSPRNQDRYYIVLYGTLQNDSGYWSLYDILGASNTYYDYDAGYQSGYGFGYNEGYDTGYADGDASGYQSGYTAGFGEASSYDSTASTIFEGIFDVGLLPVNVFLTIFNFELFGVNIAGIVSGLLTLSVVIIIVRFLLGGKKDD